MNLDGHFRFRGLTIYGRNAMHWGVTYWTERWGYVCFRLPLTCFGRWWTLYFYLSPNATPWASTFCLGGDYRSDRSLARKRRDKFGHNFNVDENYDEMRAINDE